jgi:predicted DNA-binding helix-hairpin-helix protein
MQQQVWGALRTHSEKLKSAGRSQDMNEDYELQGITHREVTEICYSYKKQIRCTILIPVMVFCSTS